ncbi:hypothetical protein HCZ30_13600 [Marivivens donghaensis]|uniref:DUF4149 domain-containing protein n=1 Tax=Marivivens donghaensis TaxID=1699413 RepID=A0ABX0VZF2_9RHOB|nr:hypothetical protein [Marivivens donghaensis]NIY73461.1 hypothetical protein [Marivivens donghaensis]
MFVPIEKARYQLATIWFAAFGLIFLCLIVMTSTPRLGAESARIWNWALPNFVPTLGLMTSVLGASAIQSKRSKEQKVRRAFCRLAVGISVFYVLVLLLVLLMPSINWWMGVETPTGPKIVSHLENSTIFMGPLQGIVIAAMGFLFFVREDSDA